MGKYRISFLTGLVTGFVLGARAGRERYDQLVKAAKTVAEHPAVQQAAGAVQAQAAGLATAAGTRISAEVRGRVPQLARTAKDKVGERVPGRRGHDHGGPGGNGHADIGDGSSFTTMSQNDGNTRN
ncbi:MAG: YtxH domain-containing protein [Actinomycetota bacterium]|nr:YtxH domain-containing protein [Actinomycetota bacterium]